VVAISDGDTLTARCGEALDKALSQFGAQNLAQIFKEEKLSTAN
jgi:hypothetical protein